MGRVLNRNGQPIQGARMEIWQANARGRYTHPGDVNPAPLDPNFEGFAVLTTDAEGRYRMKTVKPGAYPAGPEAVCGLRIFISTLRARAAPGDAALFRGRAAE